MRKRLTQEDFNLALDTITQDIENAKGKGAGWMKNALASHLQIWFAGEAHLTDAQASDAVAEWSKGVCPIL